MEICVPFTDFSSLSPVPCLSPPFKRPGVSRVSTKMAADQGQFLDLFANKLSGLLRVLCLPWQNCSTNVPYVRVVGRNSCLFEDAFAVAHFPFKMLHEQLWEVLL